MRYPLAALVLLLLTLPACPPHPSTVAGVSCPLYTSARADARP